MRGMETGQLEWEWSGKRITLGLDWRGQRSTVLPTVLLLPALSSISTRHEMRPLQERLSAHYRTVCVDWPGFGDRARPRLDWMPDAHRAFLAFVLDTVAPAPFAVIAAGHAATYALAHARAHPKAFGRLVLVAPTWRGPLPTMMNGHRPFFDRLCRLVDLPVLGPLLYQLNVNRIVIRYMAAGHVYADPAWLRGERLREKLAVTRARGARFASVRFVTGALDPLATHDEFLDLARQCEVPLLVVYGEQTPPRSRAGMAALAAIPGVRSARLPVGKLALHEECPDAVMQAITVFLAERAQA
jgi:pimeloyl-ACP methyl ester carboxylesterase